MKPATLSPRCPVGFTFGWDGDCKGQPVKSWTFEGRDSSGVPMFSESGCMGRWSPRLEAVAQAAFMARLGERVAKYSIEEVVREHLSCVCSDTQGRVRELVTALELREASVKLKAQNDVIDDIQRRMTAECGA